MPSEQHNFLAVASLRWLRQRVTGRGLRGGFEVPLADGYVPDAVAICSFQWRFAERYCWEATTVSGAVRDPELLCVFEAKASRADFKATFGDGPRHENRKQPIGNLHWCVTDPGVALDGEVPEFWGILKRRGSGLTEVRQPAYCPAAVSLDHAAYQVLWYAKGDHQKFTRPVYAGIEWPEATP